VYETRDGGYVVASASGLWGSGFYLLRTDPDGRRRWERTFGWGSAHSAQETADGGTVVSGRGGDGGNDAYVLKTDPEGALLWERAFGGEGMDIAYSVRQTADGGYIVAGSIDSFGAGGGDLYLVKIGPGGDLTWERTFGGEGRDCGLSVTQAAEGDYVVVGWTTSFGAGGNDIYLLRVSPEGDLAWQKTFGGEADDYGRSVAQTADGGLIVAGTADSVVYLLKTDPKGERLWDTRLGETCFARPRGNGWSVQQTSDHGYVVAGDFRHGGDWDWDVFIAKLEPDPAPRVLQRPGDCSQDGHLDIADGVCLLNHLFLGGPAQLPCGNGTLGDRANQVLLDSNGDGSVNLSDVVHGLTSLFMGGPPPALGTECVPIVGCPNGCQL
jgi:hypothetical protein